ncbi:MAG: OmpA family protein [Microbacter sp.]
MFVKWYRLFLFFGCFFPFVALAVHPKKVQKKASLEQVASFFAAGDDQAADSLLLQCDSLQPDYALWKAKIQFALTLKEHPVSNSPTLFSVVNSNEDTYWPSISPDHSMFAVTVSHCNASTFPESQEDVRFYRKDSLNKLIPDEEMEQRLNTPFNEGSVSFSVDGNYLFFVASDRSDGLGSCDIYYLIRHGNGWSRPIHPDGPLNTRFWESNPSLSSDGKSLYFCSNRPGGLGGMDIWSCRVEKQADGTLLFYQPVNLGKPINTMHNETSPFIDADNQTLYFSSDGHPGLGGQDLFISRKNGLGQWSTPQNLGYPINSYADEQGFSTDAKGLVGYFSSNRLQDGHRLQQIYRILLPSLDRPQPMRCQTGQVRPTTRDVPTPAYVQVVNLHTGQSIYSTIADRSTGRFTICYPDTGQFALSVIKEGYLFHFSSLDDTASINTISLTKIASGEKLMLRNIYFDFNSAQLKNSSAAELNQLLWLLKTNPSLRLLIAGHTDSIGNKAYNLQLSAERAEAVVHYLVLQGIDSIRLEWKGFGDTQPIADNRTEQGRALNRRTEAIVIDKKDESAIH